MQTTVVLSDIFSNIKNAPWYIHGSFIVASIVTVLGVIAKIRSYFDKESLKILLTTNVANDDARSRLSRAFTTRDVFIAILVAAMFLFCYLAYVKLFPARQPLPATFKLESPEPINPQTDKWLTSEPLFLPLVTELVQLGNSPSATANAKKRDGSAKLPSRPHEVYRLRTQHFGTATSMNPTSEAKCSITFPEKDYSFDPPNVFLAHKHDGQAYYTSLTTTNSSGLFSFTIPPSGPEDYILIIGQLTHLTSAEMPDALDKVFTLRIDQ